MKRFKKVFDQIFNFFEIYLPMIMFLLVFALYLLMISSRLLDTKIGKYFELCQIAFIWCGVLSASLGGRTDEHIVFSILYDKFPEKVQRILRIIGGVLIIAVFVMLIPSSFEAIDFLKIKKSDMLKIRFNLIYAPYLVFMLLTIIHYTVRLIKDIKGFFVSGREES